MASEEDNFDIDIYGDGGEDYQQHEPAAEVKPEEWSDQFMQPVEAAPQATSQPSSNEITANPDTKLEIGLDDKAPVQKIGSTDNSAPDPVHLPKHAPQTQGLKRKDGADDRHVDPGATTALFVTDLHWWVNDDDMRGWANQSQCEDELEEITFSEHKVNGKSKG